MRTGAQIMWECLVREGVTDVFGYPGGAILPAYDAMLEFPIRHILVRHEQGATHMADGYARASGTRRRRDCHLGPRRHQHGHRHRHGDDGLVADRLHHRSGRQQADRLRRLSGDRHHRHHAADHQAQLSGDAARPTSRRRSARRSRSPSRAVPVRCSSTSPRTRSRDRPSSIGSGAAPHLTEAHDDALPGDGDHREALALINGAERPLILAGHGVMLSGAEREILALAERAQIPIAVTLLGIGGVPASHPLNLGMMGMHGEAWVNTAIQEADLLLALGMRFDDRVTGNLKTYALDARKIHVDIDRAELNKNVRVDVAIAGDLRATLAEWLPHVEPGRSLGLARADRRPQGRLRGPRHPERCPTTATCMRRT